MAAIAEAESSGNSAAYNPSGASGLWQILGAVNPSDQSSLFNPQVNAKEAVLKYQTQGLGAWVTYTSGAYKQFLQGSVPPSAVTSQPTSNATSSGTAPPAGGATLTTDTGNTNPLEEGFGAVGSWINLVPFLGGFVKTIGDGANAVGSVNHLLAYLIDYPLSMFKPGQAWRLVFTAVTALLAFGSFKVYSQQSGNAGHEKLPLAILLLGGALLTGFMAFRPWPNPDGKAIKPGAYAYEILEGQVPAAGPPAISPAEVQTTEFAMDLFAAIWALQKMSGTIDNIATAIEEAKQAALGWWGNLF